MRECDRSAAAGPGQASARTDCHLTTTRSRTAPFCTRKGSRARARTIRDCEGAFNVADVRENLTALTGDAQERRGSASERPSCMSSCSHRSCSGTASLANPVPITATRGQMTTPHRHRQCHERYQAIRPVGLHSGAVHRLHLRLSGLETNLRATAVLCDHSTGIILMLLGSEHGSCPVAANECPSPPVTPLEPWTRLKAQHLAKSAR